MDTYPPPSETELQDFIESVSIALRRVSKDGTILWANPADMNLLGYSAVEEYVGHNIREFHFDPEEAGNFLARLKNDGNLIGYECRMRCKNGSIRDVSISSTVYRQGQEFAYAHCVTLDITDQRKNGDLHERLSAIVESSDDAIISKDLNGIILSWNGGAERIFGYTEEEVVGKHISVIAASDRIDEIPTILRRISLGERVDHYQTRRRAKDGSILTVSLTISPIRDAVGNVVGASKVARDITQRERQDQALRQANEALTRSNEDLQLFAYSASHDLQEPLRMISTYSEMLLRDFADKLGPDGAEYLDYTVKGALRMEQLLSDLRTYTIASTAGEQPVENADASAVLVAALEGLQAARTESGATITAEPLPRVRVHEFQLAQLFQNLISNAIRYRGDRPPVIHVAAREQGEHWLFSVRDNGIGISPQYKDQIFDLFKRLHSVSEYPGTGMGLAICKRIVERAGGRMWVESEPGSGSTFFFTLPRK